jgi:hypothetical protein
MAISGDINGNSAVPTRPRAIMATTPSSRSKATIFFTSYNVCVINVKFIYLSAAKSAAISENISFTAIPKG